MKDNTNIDNFCLERGFERLKIIDSNFRYKKWYFEYVLDIPESFRVNRSFYETETISVENFNPDLITGTYHSSYNKGLMWIEML